MSTNDALYPYDPSGTQASNRVISEPIDVYDTTGSDRAMFVILKAAPFFADSLVLKTSVGTGGTTLIEGTDYILTHMFHAATDALSARIMGSILFLNKQYIGRLYATYQTLGGDYVLDDTRLAEELTRDLYSIRTVAWDQLQVQITGFPPYGHDHVASNLIGLGELVDSTDRIAAAITDVNGGGGSTPGGGGNAALQAHISASTNAHNKSAVQLGNVENYGIANMNDVANSVANKYITPSILRQSLAVYAVDTSTINQRLTALEGMNTDYTQYKTTVNGQLLGINNSITTVNNSLTELEGSFLALTQSVSTALDIINDQSGDVEDHEGRLDVLEVDNTANKESIGDINYLVAAVRSNVSENAANIVLINNKLNVIYILPTELKTATTNNFEVTGTDTLKTKIANAFGYYSDTSNHVVVPPYYVTSNFFVRSAINTNSPLNLNIADNTLYLSAITTTPVGTDFELNYFEPSKTNGHGIGSFKFKGTQPLSTLLSFNLSFVKFGVGDVNSIFIKEESNEYPLAYSTHTDSKKVNNLIFRLPKVINDEITTDTAPFTYLVDGDTDDSADVTEVPLAEGHLNLSSVYDRDGFTEDPLSDDNYVTGDITVIPDLVYAVKLPSTYANTRVYVVNGDNKLLAGSGRWSGDFMFVSSTDKVKIQLCGVGDSPITTIHVYPITLSLDSNNTSISGVAPFTFLPNKVYSFNLEKSATEIVAVSHGYFTCLTDVSEKVRMLANALKI